MFGPVKLGKLHLPSEDLQENLEAIDQLFHMMNLELYVSWYDKASKTHILYATSEQFHGIDEGDTIPEYGLQFSHNSLTGNPKVTLIMKI